MSRSNAENTEPVAVWPVVVAVGTEDPQRLDRQLAAGRLPRDAKRVLWRHLKSVHQALAQAIQSTTEAFPGCELRVTLTGRSKRIQDVLKAREGKGEPEPDHAVKAA